MRSSMAYLCADILRVLLTQKFLDFTHGNVDTGSDIRFPWQQSLILSYTAPCQLPKRTGSILVLCSRMSM